MQAPTLFIIAADLTKMQVNANIDEADVGRIRPGQHVTFRVDAYPTDNFEGTVSQIRLQPVVVSNVTTYGTVIDVPNPQLKLKPGMTANVKVEIAKRTDVLRVPNAALRFRPTADVFAALNQPVPPEAHAGGGRARRAAGARRSRGRNTAAGGAAAATGRARRRHAARRRQPAAECGAGTDRRRGQAGAGGRRRGRTGGGGGGRGFDPGPHDGTLQEHVARRAEAVHRAHEGSRSGHERVREAPPQSRPPREPRRNLAQPLRRRRSTRCSRRCRSSNRAAARGSS